jgi:peptidoglycan/xylan/chitin deacetylase (PgdA/CDA1 family)
MKTLIKRILIPALSSRPISFIAERFVNPGIPIFMFHRFISPDNPDKGHDPSYLNDCLNYLRKNNYNFVSVEQIAKSISNKTKLPGRSVAFTMDDGFEDQATIAAPVFLAHKCPVTIFLISGMIDGELWPWDDQVSHMINNTARSELSLKLVDNQQSFKLTNRDDKRSAIQNIQNWIKTLDAENMSDYLLAISNATQINMLDIPPSNYKPMSWDQARELEAKGIQFAPHTRSHRILSRLVEGSAREEIEHSFKRLREELSSPSPIFCYPTGGTEDYTDRDIALIQQAGLIGAVSTTTTFVNPNRAEINYPYQLPRFGFPDSFLDFIQYSSWIERAKA